MQQSEKSNPTTKRWRDVKNKEINQQKKNYCLYCEYSSTIGSGVVCDYIGKTGKRRGCSPIGCVKFERRKGRRKKNE